MEKKWNWQQKNWPQFEYKLETLQSLLYQYAKLAGHTSAYLATFSEIERTDAMLDIMVSEALNTSAIEGENIQPQEIRSSIKKQLGLADATSLIHDQRAEGIASLMIAVRNTHQMPLSKDMLFEWHEKLMLGSDPFQSYEWGMWRTGKDPMQIVSGPIGTQRVHFEAPPSHVLEKEMNAYIHWFNLSEKTISSGPLRAGIAHLYFESIHPFQDGNGRIGRAIAEKTLSQDLGCAIPYSISSVIEKNKKEYYRQLSLASGSSLEITGWLIYFIEVLLSSLHQTKSLVEFSVKKSNFWNRYQHQLNLRQTMILQRMFKEGLSGFEGGMHAKKYMSIAKVSKATATRDLTELHDWGCLKKLPGGGRNTRYEINLD